MESHCHQNTLLILGIYRRKGGGINLGKGGKKLVIKPKAKVVAPVKKIEPKKPAAIKVKPQVKAPIKVAVKPVNKAPAPAPKQVAKPKAVIKPAPAPVAEPVESTPVEVEAAPAEPATAPVAAPKTHEKSHSQDVEKIQ